MDFEVLVSALPQVGSVLVVVFLAWRSYSDSRRVEDARGEATDEWRVLAEHYRLRAEVAEKALRENLGITIEDIIQHRLKTGHTDALPPVSPKAVPPRPESSSQA